MGAVAVVAAALNWGAATRRIHESRYPVPNAECSKDTECAEKALQVQAREAAIAQSGLQVAFYQLALSLAGVLGVGLTIYYAHKAWKESERSANAAQDALDDARVGAEDQTRRFEAQLAVATAAAESSARLVAAAEDKGHSALQLSRDLDCQYKTAFVLSHKIREALAAEQAASTISGEVEVDGAYFGGYVKPANRREDRKDRRLKMHQTGKRQVVVVARERNGETLTHVAKTEAAGVPFVMATVAAGATVHADEASHWDNLEARFLTRRINHSVEYSTPEACTNMAESFFSRIRRAEVGIHHHIAGRYLAAYATEMAWREDNRRVSNGEQFLIATGAALAHPVSRQWKGYWQR